MTLNEAIAVLRDHVEEHRYHEDRSPEYSECDSCGWNTDDDVKKGEMGWGPEPHHRPGCKLREALDVTRHVLETA